MMKLVALIFAFAHGMIVSAAVSVVIAVLGIAPHLASITRTYERVNLYGYALIVGIFVTSAVDLFGLRITTGTAGTALLALLMLFYGMFTGVFLSALAEAFDIFPMFTGKLKLDDMVKWLVIALAIGKTGGALVSMLLPIFQFS